MRIITKELIRLSETTIFSLHELRQVKYEYHLTDYGVQLLIEPAAAFGTSLNKAAYHMDILEERNRLGEAIFVLKTEAAKTFFIPQMVEWLNNKLH